MPVAIITGALGQDGSYLAEHLSSSGWRVVGTTHRLEAIVTPPPAPLTRLAYVDPVVATAIASILEEFRPHVVFNLAARASSRQLADDPPATIRVNGLAPVLWLEAIFRMDRRIRFVQASSSEMFGAAAEAPQGETTPCAPRNPYGHAKLLAHRMMGHYRSHHGLHASSGILYNHESPRRGREFVTRRIAIGAARIYAGLDEQLAVGDLSARRDWCAARDAVRALALMGDAPTPDDYVIATGVLHSVADACEAAFAAVDLDWRRHVVQDPSLVRAHEAVPLVGDPRRINDALGWYPAISFEDMLRDMVRAELAAIGHSSQ